MNADYGVTRRSFMKTVGFTAAASSQTGASTWASQTGRASAGKPALLGGTPVHQGPWPDWPQEEPPDEAIMIVGGGEKLVHFGGPDGATRMVEL